MDRITTLYHGSKNIVCKPMLHGGKPSNDYGYGFYCTESKELASEWACSDNRDGFANEYEIDMSGLNVVDLTQREYSIVNWIAVLMQNRIPCGVNNEARGYIENNFNIELSEADVIIGYRADDSYYSFARDFMRNAITVGQLSKAMEQGDAGIEVVLHTQMALERVRYSESGIASSEVYYTRRVARDRRVKDEYMNKTRLMRVESDDLYLKDIVRQGVRNDDPRIRRDICR